MHEADIRALQRGSGASAAKVWRESGWIPAAGRWMVNAIVRIPTEEYHLIILT
jgi:hypothetical protein